MKGVIVNCLKEVVTNKFGKDKWEAALVKAGVDRNVSFLASQDIDDATVLKVVGAVCAVLNISLAQAADAFGEHWVCSYAPKIYKAYFVGMKSSRDFLMKMDEIHRMTTQNIPNAHPPRFDYNWENEKTLIMTYKSQRGLLEFMRGLVVGVGKYFKEDLKVFKASNNSLRVVFP
jgi:heme-NO-binding protein